MLTIVSDYNNVNQMVYYSSITGNVKRAGPARGNQGATGVTTSTMWLNYASPVTGALGAIGLSDRASSGIFTIRGQKNDVNCLSEYLGMRYINQPD